MPRNPVLVYANTMVRLPGRGGEAFPAKVADEWFFSSTTNTIISEVRDRKGGHHSLCVIMKRKRIVVEEPTTTLAGAWPGRGR